MRNSAKGGPLTNTQKMKNESASECGYLYGTKTKSRENRKKASKKRRTQQPTENPKNTEYPNASQMGPNFLHLPKQSGRFTPMHPRQLRDCCRPVLNLLTVQK